MLEKVKKVRFNVKVVRFGYPCTTIIDRTFDTALEAYQIGSGYNDQDYLVSYKKITGIAAGLPESGKFSFTYEKSGVEDIRIEDYL